MWGITYERTTPNPKLPAYVPYDIPLDATLPSFPKASEGFELQCFVDAAHANDLRNRRSTTGYGITMRGGVVAYRSITQSITATSSTEAEFMAAVTAVKQVRYLRAILNDLGFKLKKPTPIYEDNMSAINIINDKIPTERSRHIDIQYFAIQDWRENGDIIMVHIPGIINPADSMTKPIGWMLHWRHVRRFMGHYLLATDNGKRPVDSAALIEFINFSIR